MIFYHAETDQYIDGNQRFDIGDTSYQPPAQMTKAELYSAGLAPIKIIGEERDYRYYTNSSDRLSGVETITSTPRPLDEIRQRIASEIDTKRVELLAAGVSHTFSDGSIGVIQTRSDTDMINLSGNVIAAMARKVIGSTEPFFYITADNVVHQLTADEMIATGLVVQPAVTAIYVAARAKKDALGALDFDALVAYDIEAGWPV